MKADATIRPTVDERRLAHAKARLLANGIKATDRETIEYGLALILTVSVVDLPVGVIPGNHPAKIKPTDGPQ